jgi:hypothetical protein
MNRRQGTSILQWFSFLLILGAVGIFTVQVVRFSRQQTKFTIGQLIAGVPVGGTDRAEAAERLLAVYSTPIELHYGDALIHLSPDVIGFDVDLESMLAAADLERTQQSFWLEFWDYLWERSIQTQPVPLKAEYEEARLRAYLGDEIAARYDQPPLPAKPVVGTVKFEPGQIGTTLDVEAAVTLIEQALLSPTHRTVRLPTQRQAPGRPAMGNLEILLKQTIGLEPIRKIVRGTSGVRLFRQKPITPEMRPDEGYHYQTQKCGLLSSSG